MTAFTMTRAPLLPKLGRRRWNPAKISERCWLTSAEDVRFSGPKAEVVAGAAEFGRQGGPAGLLAAHSMPAASASFALR